MFPHTEQHTTSGSSPGDTRRNHKRHTRGGVSFAVWPSLPLAAIRRRMMAQFGELAKFLSASWTAMTEFSRLSRKFGGTTARASMNIHRSRFHGDKAKCPRPTSADLLAGPHSSSGAFRRRSHAAFQTMNNVSHLLFYKAQIVFLHYSCELNCVQAPEWLFSY